MEAITNEMDAIDSMDILCRIEEIEASDCENESLEELENLRSVIKMVGACVGLEYSELLIHADYFTGHCRVICEEDGTIPNDLPDYIARHICWDSVADDIKADYATIDFDGVIYYIHV